ncbi:MAG: 50S ribosomal protein L9 [Gammaproteobacteria bacterium]
MEVILLEKVENLGDLGDRVKIKPGYGRNYLIPQGKATSATPKNVARFEERRAELEKAAADAVAAANTRREALEALVGVTVTAKAGDEGKLFGSIGTTDIAHAITEAGVAVERHEVRLPEGPFRAVGEYEVEVHLHSDVNASVKLTVAAQ